MEEENVKKSANSSDSANYFYEVDEEFRNTLATVDKEGKRIWLYPKKPSGAFHNKRIYVTILLLAILFAGPFLTIGGKPFLLLNFFDREFIIFGSAFWPQDFFLLALVLITFFVFIILFTVAFGRIWCGWACPQTLFMEMVFRKIEYLIEGDAKQQKKLNSKPWDAEKILKKGSKQLIFIIISLLISHTVMAYLIGIDETILIVSQPPSEHLSGFIGLMVFTGIFYFVFSYFREQACVAVCPYGRLQGVLLVKESIVVIYDWLRGEPRGKIKKGSEKAEQKGDCIDCNWCVHVCPTGIDIRNGTQLECVNCTACIDACDEVMEKVDKPKGLIKYSSPKAIDEGKNKLFTPRVAGYSAVLIILVTILSYLVLTRSDIEASIFRVPGQTYQKTEDGKISNLFNIQFVNKTFEDKEIRLELLEIPGGIIEQVGKDKISIPSNELYDGVFFIKIPSEKLHPGKNMIDIAIYDGEEIVEIIDTSFFGPMPGRQ
ncbi:MAG: cytochrome c oxidase accessory protein CcoG [Cyclobacteriaceae bacterium]|nr:cytochrome c oxidase accessory protein CcoG [Cyclobacteriaceae bacterium]